MILAGAGRRIAAGLGLLTGIWALAPAPVRAQVVDDTIPADSVRDTTDYTARFLQERERATVRTPVLPRLSESGPHVPSSRIVFTRDSIEWGNAVTVGDLLQHVPGVYLWRGGWFGRPEPVSYQGRGTSSAEYLVDGIPWVAAGADSLSVDPGLFSTSFLDRIEVERGPGRIRVFLYTRRHDRLAPRSRIGIARGDQDFARYEGSLERRSRSGLGVVLAADYLSAPTATGTSSSYRNTQVWAQGSYLPSERFGIQYQLLRSRPDRRPYATLDRTTGLTDTIGLGYKATRTDAQFRIHVGPQLDGPGRSLDLIYARTAWDGSGIDQQINQLGGQLRYRAGTFGAGASAFYRTRWTALDVRGNAGWTPSAAISFNGEAVLQHHRGGRTSRYVSASAGLAPVPGVALTGTARLGRDVAAPSILTDSAQEIRDYELAAGWSRSRLGLRLAYARTSTFQPYSFPEFPRVAALATAPRTTWLTASARVAPLRWLSLDGWYSDPRGTLTPDGLPPTHSLVAATLRSKFLRQFRSGIFDLELRLAMESWGTGIIGRDIDGAPIRLKGATFLRTLIQFQLQDFIVFWDRTNLTGSDLTYVPGFDLLSYGSTFGVRWQFLN
ncbi:MAG: TonB-dependent receptor plug domain-containing protein [Gemmatimonadales bacterium]|nr:TonB-dependent receptor plug domain-containing protein [Gemmatimonadales bacterium]